MGLTVGWIDRISWPQLGQRPSLPLLSDDDADMAGTAAPVEGPTLFAEVPVFGGDGLELAADAAWFPPDAVMA